MDCLTIGTDLPIVRAMPSNSKDTKSSGTLLLLAVATALSVGWALDPDLFWHLRTGELIVNDGLPRGDVFSFTVPGRDWITHEWGSQVILWGLWSLGGSAALIISFTLVAAIVWLLAYRTSTARPIMTGAVIVVAAAASRVSTAPRPQMFNLIGVALIIYLLERIRHGRLDPKWLWSMPAIVAVWANLHSGYLLGVVVLGVYAVGERLEAGRSAEPGQAALPAATIRRLPAVTAASFFAAALNPSTWELWVYPFVTLRSEAMRTHIAEWSSPDFHEPALAPFAFMLGLTVLALVAGRRRIGWTAGLLVLGTGFAALQSQRHIQLFAVVAIPLVAEHLDAAWIRFRNDDRPLTTVLARSRTVGMLTSVLAVLTITTMLSGAIASNDDALADLYPVDAVDAILDSELADANGYNAYEWGGYLIWRDVPVFIDGRADVYGDDFMNLYFTAENVEADWREPLDLYDVEYVLLPEDADLGVLLAEAEDWQSVYTDAVAEVFVRCTDDCPLMVQPTPSE